MVLCKKCVEREKAVYPDVREPADGASRQMDIQRALPGASWLNGRGLSRRDGSWPLSQKVMLVTQSGRFGGKKSGTAGL